MPDNRQLRKTKRNLSNAAHYSGIGFQMVIVILAGTFGGIKLDQMTQTDFPVFTVTLAPLSVFLALYLVLKEFMGKK